MKSRFGFVSNSSSSSFLLQIDNKTDEKYSAKEWMRKNFPFIKKVFDAENYTTLEEWLEEERGIEEFAGVIPPNSSVILRCTNGEECWIEILDDNHYKFSCENDEFKCKFVGSFEF